MAVILILFTLAVLVAIVAWLMAVVKQAAVEPVIDGKFPVKLFSEKRRYQALWEDWGRGLVVGFVVGAMVGWIWL